MTISPLQQSRYSYKPKLPSIFLENLENIAIVESGSTESVGDREELKALFANTYGKPLVSFQKGSNPNIKRELAVGVILSGGQAPGGHNVIAGLFDGLKRGNEASRLFGFLGGPSGFIEGTHIEITSSLVDKYRNTGGFDIIGSGRTKIETDAQIAASMETAKKMNLDAVVIIGGDDSNTNAALLAEHFINANIKTQVIGVPKTIDGDLKNNMIEISFGFDTAAKTYSELIGNIERDVNSAKKYWHFIKLMGRSASHIALECALQTQPNICLISEEVAEKKMTLRQIRDEICEVIIARAEQGENFGVILIPEGVIEFVPEMQALIAELNDIIATKADVFNELPNFEAQKQWLLHNMNSSSAVTFAALPEDIAKQFLMERDPHGNVQVSRIETEKLILSLVEIKLKRMAKDGKYKGKFSSYCHFFGYEGRSAFPSNFDADYCYSLGFTAFVLAASGLTGYLSSVRNLTAPASEWVAGGVPLTMMMDMEKRSGVQKPVIKKALVDLNGKPFKALEEGRKVWATKTSYVYPGAIQYLGPDELCNRITHTLMLEKG